MEDKEKSLGTLIAKVFHAQVLYKDNTLGMYVDGVWVIKPAKQVNYQWIWIE